MIFIVFWHIGAISRKGFEMNNKWLFSSKLSSAGVRIGILAGIILLIISSIVSWSLVVHKSEPSQKAEKGENPLAAKVEELQKRGDILYANIKETDEWVARRDQLVRALSTQLPTDIVVGEVVDLASASKNEDEARLYLRDLGRVFEVSKNPLILTSKEVKIREIGDKIRQKEVKVVVK